MRAEGLEEGAGIPGVCSSPAKTWPRAAALAQSSPQRKGREGKESEREKGEREKEKKKEMMG